MAKASFRAEVTDNSRAVIQQEKQNIKAALNAMGIKAVNLILWQMRQGFGRPIRKTGDLQRDVKYEVNKGAKTVTVDNSLEYGVLTIL